MDYIKQNYMLILFKSLANASRLKVLQLLLEKKEPMTVTQIIEKLDIDQGNFPKSNSKCDDWLELVWC